MIKDDRFAVHIMIDNKTITSYTLRSGYAPVVAFLDIWYRNGIALDPKKFRKTPEILHYLSGLRNAFEDELSTHSSDTIVTSSWRSEVLHQWASRAYRSLGHSTTGRARYCQQVTEEGGEAYKVDILKLGKSFVYHLLVSQIPIYSILKP
jgi:hypothetical protein